MNSLIIFLLFLGPVLYEGRYRPVETVPAGVEVEVVQNYGELAGSAYLVAEGKALYYPSYGQLFSEWLLYVVPFKWIIIVCYALALVRWRSFLVVGFCLHTLVLALRCYVLGRPPVSNMAETILYVPWVAVVVGFFFNQRAALVAAIAILLFLPARVGLENVQAVLDSQYWLMIHVMMVVGSYGILLVAGVLGHLLLLKKKVSEQKLIQCLYLGTGLLIGGTILGGIWAAESWGRFWDWDPKEAWAFISSGIYLITIHAYRFKKMGRYGLAVGSIIGLMAITFTWYGVNYILGTGLHSYGFGNGGEIFYYLYLVGEVAFLAFTCMKMSHYSKRTIEKKEPRM